MKKTTERTKKSETDKGFRSLSTDPDYKFKEEDLEVTLEEVVDHSGPTIGLNYSFLALKNSTSYAIATSIKRLFVVEDEAQAYSDRLYGSSKFLRDLVYIDHLDCYLLNQNNRIYRKKIDERVPSPFIRLHCGYERGRCLLYSKLNRRLIIPIQGKNIAVVNLERKQVEIQIKMQQRPYIRDFKLFGRRENKIVWVVSGGSINRCSISYDLKKITTKSSSQLRLLQERNEVVSGLEVGEQGKLLLVGLESKNLNFSSRIIIFELKSRVIVPLTILDEVAQRLPTKKILSFFSCFGRHIVWACFSKSEARFYDFDLDSLNLKEIAEKRVDYGDEDPLKVVRISQDLYYVGKKGKLMKFGIRLK